MQVSCLLKPAYTETYFFNVPNSLVKNTDKRKSGVELWIDNKLVIADGTISGSLKLDLGSWAEVKLLYRVTLNKVEGNISTAVP